MFHMTQTRIIHAFDAGAPKSLDPSGLAERFHAWRGVSGKRYLVTVYPAAIAPLFEGAVMLFARREADGTRVALWAGRAPADEGAMILLASRLRADEVHVHLMAEAEADRARVERDLVSPATALAPATG